jgi:hypothetical protein
MQVWIPYLATALLVVDLIFILFGSGSAAISGDMGKMAYPGRNEKNYFYYFRFPRFYAGCRAKKPENRPQTAPWPGNTINKPSYGVTHWFSMHWVKVTEVTLF